MKARIATLDLSTWTETDIDLLLEGLDCFEEKSGALLDSVEKAKVMARALEAHAENCPNCHDDDDGDGPNIATAIESLKAEIQHQERERTKQHKVNRERVTLVKARLILAMQANAVEKLSEQAYLPPPPSEKKPE